MKKLFILFFSLIFAATVCAEDLITVPTKSTGNTLTAAEFNQLLNALKDGTKSAFTESLRQAALSSAPSSPVTNAVYLADNSSWDPASIDGTDPYFVVYDGTDYNPLFDINGVGLYGSLSANGSTDPTLEFKDSTPSEIGTGTIKVTPATAGYSTKLYLKGNHNGAQTDYVTIDGDAEEVVVAKDIDLTGSLVASKFIQGGIAQYKDGSADGDIQALSDTTSVGTDGDPLELTSAEVMGTTVTNLGATGALYFQLPSPAIGHNVIFNVDVAQNVFIKPPSTTDIYWKDYDDTGFASGGADKDVQINQSVAIGDRVFCQARKVGSTIEWFCWSDCDGAIIEP
jgi:hypothetical protein